MTKTIKRINLKSTFIPVIAISILGSVILGMAINIFIYFDMPDITISGYTPSAWDRLETIFSLMINNIGRYFVLGIIIAFIFLLLIGIYNVIARFYGGISININE